MSLYYGHDDEPIFYTQRNRLSYFFNYDSVLLDVYEVPTWSRHGHPIQRVPGTRVNDDTEFTVVLHEFDNDSTITTDLAIKYKFVAIMKDGSKREIELDNITDMNSKRTDNGGNRYFLVNYTVRIGDIMSDGSEIVIFYIAFTRTAGSSGGCESIITLEVVF